MTARTSFRGSFTALAHPFPDGIRSTRRHFDASDRLANRKREPNGLVPVGTTGESPTLSHKEHQHIVEWCVEAGSAAGFR